jgi:hypothetical protein
VEVAPITRADATARPGSRTSLDKGRAESPSVREQHKWLTPHLLSRRPIYRWSGKGPSGASPENGGFNNSAIELLDCVDLKRRWRISVSS